MLRPPLLALAHNGPPSDSTMERMMANPHPAALRLGGKERRKKLIHLLL
jgi:hypothetical protein